MTVVSRYTLITNLDYVVIGGVRTRTHALLVSRTEGLFAREQPEFKLRGFSTDPSLPTFDAWLQTDEYELVDAVDRSAVFVGGNGKPEPLFSGAIMIIAGGPNAQLIRGANSNRAIDVHRFPDGTNNTEVWPMLEEKVAEYWTQDCCMPVANWQLASYVYATRKARNALDRLIKAKP